MKDRLSVEDFDGYEHKFVMAQDLINGKKLFGVYNVDQGQFYFITSKDQNEYSFDSLYNAINNYNDL